MQKANRVENQTIMTFTVQQKLVRSDTDDGNFDVLITCGIEGNNDQQSILYSLKLPEAEARRVATQLAELEIRRIKRTWEAFQRDYARNFDE